jgi:LysM repeat protein
MGGGTVTAPAQATTAVPTADQTVISTEPTATSTTGAQAADGTSSVTPIPSITPTTVPGATATPTTVPGATATPTTAVAETATPTPTTEATPTQADEFEYTVSTGDTLWGLAIRYGTTVQAIKTRNGLTSDIIYKGQKLIIPVSGDGGEGEVITHVVQPGENLFRIALKYGTTVGHIAALNNIVNPNFVYVGQELRIVKGATTPGGPTTTYHVVQRGETLWSIAMRYGTTPWKIAAANGISNINFIYAGRTLRIP